MAKAKTAKTIEDQIKKVAKVQTLPTADVPTFYVNSANIEISSFDVRFRLGQIQGVENDVLTIKEVAYVFMSHEHFKAFANIVHQNASKLDEGIEALKRVQAGAKAD